MAKTTGAQAVTLRRDKECKGSVRFVAEGDATGDRPPILSNAYLSRYAGLDLDGVQAVTVTVKVGA